MGKAARLRPKRLGAKLRQIRDAFGLSQNGIIRHLGLTDVVAREHISAFELGKREPPLLVLLRYARAADVAIDVLADDDIDLPKRIPATGPRKEKSKISSPPTGRKS